MIVIPPRLSGDSSLALIKKPQSQATVGPRSLLVVEFLFGWTRVDDAVVDLERHAVEEFAAGAGRTCDTFAARRLEIGVMRLAHQITPLLGEELVIDPIHRHRHVPAAI